MEAASSAASAAAAAAKEAASAACIAAAAAAKDAAAAAATAKEATAAAKEVAVAASAAALNAKEAAATASAAALNAKESAAVAAFAGEAAAAAVQACNKKRKFQLMDDDQDPPGSASADAGESADFITHLPDAILGSIISLLPNKEGARTQAISRRTKESAAVAASAGEATAAAATAGEAAAATASAAAAAMQASNKKRKFHVMDNDQDPQGNANVDDGESADFITRLPDAILGSIVSLLPTKEGARTQAISRRWRPLWRSAPLNLLAGDEFQSKGGVTIDLIPKILAEHPGPARRLSLSIYIRDCYDKIQGWLSSQALDNLQELDLTYKLTNLPWLHGMDKRLYPLPLSAYRFAPTLRMAKFSICHLPYLIVKRSLEFLCLKQLTLDRVTISENVLRSMLSGCHVLENLELKNNFGFGRLCINSQTIKSISFCAGWTKEGAQLQELVIEDAPCLERLLPLHPKVGPVTIRVISAPKLKILGILSKFIVELQFGTTVFQKMIALGLTTKMHTVKVLVLDPAGLNLDEVVNFLKCFPCLERLYLQSASVMTNVRKYDPVDPIECLELHLKEVVLKNYDGLGQPRIDFTKFFVLNAKVLMEMKIILPYHRQHKWFANQRRLLQIENRASRDARIELTCGSGTFEYFTHNSHTHDLSMADPFDTPFIGCSKCR